MSVPNLKIVMATGGSGGHLFPAIKTARYLRNLGHEILFLGSFGVGAEKLIQEGFQCKNFSGQGLTSKNPIYLIRTFCLIVKAFWGCLFELKRFQADVVVGFGGYGSFAAIIAAGFLGRPILIHEQNVVPGRVNRWVSFLAKKIAISFQESSDYFLKQKIVLTGCPTHINDEAYSRTDVLKELNLKEGYFTIFVFGGSQGSHRINQVFLNVIKRITNDYKIQVIHIPGVLDLKIVLEQYQKMQIPHAVYPFFNQMGKAYFVSDLVIGRSGASTVTEIAMFKKPSILIPYPFAKGHQKENALVLSKRNLARLIEEKDLTEDVLKDAIEMAYKNRTIIDLKLSAVFSEVYLLDSHVRLGQEIVRMV